MAAYVFRPIIMGRPIVSDRNRLRLDGIRQGMSPPRPMTPFRVAATTKVILKGFV